jgi:hypothetical protein
MHLNGIACDLLLAMLYILGLLVTGDDELPSHVVAAQVAKFTP